MSKRKPRLVKVAGAPFRITASALEQSRRKRRRSDVNPFVLPQFPKAALPPRSQQLAMDDALGQTIAWAGSGWVGESLFDEGMAFLGYPYLSALAQRPEYRVISEVIATEMTRKFCKIVARGDEDKSDKIKVIEDAFGRLEVRKVFRQAATMDGFFGRSHIYLDVGDATDDPVELRSSIGNGRTELSKQKVEKNSLRALRAIEPVWVYPTNYNSNDPLKRDWYHPSVWFVMGKQVHESRCLTLIGREVPDLLKPAYSFGGLSLSQMAKPYVDNWLRTRQSVADIIHSFVVFVLKTQLAQSLQAGGEQLFKRAEFFNNMRDNQSLMMLDKEGEEFENVQASLSGLDSLQAQTQEHMAAVSRIPLVKLLGITPQGLNASSEGEIRVFYDTIEAQQSALFDDPLKTILAFVQLSELGEVDPDITFEWVKLWSMTEKEAAEVREADARTGDILIADGTISPAEERARVAHDPASPYQGLDVDDLPQVEEGPENIDIRGTERPPQFVAKDEGDSRTVLIVRHGATAYNNDDVSTDRIRGWKNIPLSPEGRAEAEKLGERLLRSGLPASLVSSDLKRAWETADIVSDATGVPIVGRTMSLRPWNVGELAGKTSAEGLPVLTRYAKDKSDEVVPGGESFDAFRSRLLRGLDDILSSTRGVVGLVTHHRVERLLLAWAAAGFPLDGSVDMGEFGKRGERTGAVTPLAIPLGALRAAASEVEEAA